MILAGGEAVSYSREEHLELSYLETSNLCNKMSFVLTAVVRAKQIAVQLFYTV